MSFQTPNHYCASRLKLVFSMFTVCTILPSKTQAQMEMETWKRMFDNRCTLEDFTTFEREVPLAYGKIPKLKKAVPALDPLEVALQPWGANREMENRCMQLLLAERGKRLIQLNALHDLHSSVIDEVWASTTLPLSFRWIPAMTSGWNQSAKHGNVRTGLWYNKNSHATDIGATIDDTIDERGVPATSTELAINQLEKLQRRFPNDPHRTLVAYLKGMSFATRWNGQPGADKELDEWLAMFKVVSRMMVNMELQNHQLDWLDVLSKWERITCTGKLSRQDLMDQHNLSASVLTQFLPWWTGIELPCSALDSYEFTLPKSLASRWKTRSESSTTISPKALSEIEIIAEAEGTSYTIAYTCHMHEVKSGDTLWNISKRYPGTTPEWIAEINEISHYIRIGEFLCIPIQP